MKLSLSTFYYVENVPRFFGLLFRRRYYVIFNGVHQKKEQLRRENNVEHIKYKILFYYNTRIRVNKLMLEIVMNSY